MIDTLGPAWLFCPAIRPDRFTKAAEASDVVILDLEDGVAAAERPQARVELVATRLDPLRTIVRVNGVGTIDHAADLSAVRRAGYSNVMLAKAESAEQLAAFGDLDVIALCETPSGVLHAESIAAADPVVALMWGSEDLVASLGISASRLDDGTWCDAARHGRNTVLYAAAAAGKAVVDTVHTDIGDLGALATEAAEAATGGFEYKACIHPAQVPVVRAAYAPGPEQVEWAQRILAAARTRSGAFALDGRMIDEPVLRQARLTLQRLG